MLKTKRVVQRQVGEAMLSSRDTSSGNTLHQDGTSKFHRHFQSFQITTSEGKSLSARLSEVARGDAATLFEEFDSVISELASCIQSDHQTTIAQLVVSLISTMSDQRSVNPL